MVFLCMCISLLHTMPSSERQGTCRLHKRNRTHQYLLSRLVKFNYEYKSLFGECWHILNDGRVKTCWSISACRRSAADASSPPGGAFASLPRGSPNAASNISSSFCKAWSMSRPDNSLFSARDSANLRSASLPQWSLIMKLSFR